MPASHSRLELGIVEPGTRVLVLGFAREGASVARFLAERAATIVVADRTITAAGPLHDDSTGRIDVAPESVSLLEAADVVVTSPGIPDDNVVLAEARHLGIPITTPTQIFFALCPCPIVGVTGSSGKSTTTALIARILSTAGHRVGLGGNIGTPMLDLLPDLSPGSTAVIELSSFQLALMRRSPHISVITNLTPNHLDRHGDMAHYIAAKRNILKFQSPSDIAVLNAADPTVRLMGIESNARLVWFRIQDSEQPGVFIKDGRIIARSDAGYFTVMDAGTIQIPGRHNIENVLAAAAVGVTMGIPADTIRLAIASFTGLEHRLQTVAEVQGVRYINDSIATSPERAARGIEAMNAPVILIAGGRSKHLAWDPVIAAMDDKVRIVVLIGEATDEIENALFRAPGWAGRAISRASSVPHAVALARNAAQPGDVVLLSPGCTSFDMFTDFEERGRLFTAEVLDPSWQS